MEMMFHIISIYRAAELRVTGDIFEVVLVRAACGSALTKEPEWMPQPISLPTTCAVKSTIGTMRA